VGLADGRLVALPNHKCRKSVIEYIAKIASCDDAKLEAVAEKILDAKPKRNHKKKADEADKVVVEINSKLEDENISKQ
jgi:hypothetical protein